MIALNTCPKCDGTLRLQTDAYGVFLTCLMCGAHITAKCPHCNASSIQFRLEGGSMFVECRICECVNKELASEECSRAAALAS